MRFLALPAQIASPAQSKTWATRADVGNDERMGLITADGQCFPIRP
ncbi:hypothetical protein [Aliiroseovarius subalbicans]|nr:hypothetical protein [Aliiroseovarius subalbicans]MCI2398699.1 hypothetical protein [Aliiroseovarius subalbicans]